MCSCAPNVVRAKRRQQNNSTRGDVHNNMNKSISAAKICCFWQGSAGDPRGIRWGSSGDPPGFRGIRPVAVSVWPTFFWDPSEGTAVFYNIKKSQAVWALKIVGAGRLALNFVAGGPMCVLEF